MSDQTIINREHWLTELVLRLEPMVQARGKKLPKWRISCSFPGTRARPSAAKAGHRIGECWAEKNSADGTREMFISPILDDPIEIAEAVLHEMVHAVLPPEVGHKAQFARLAKATGLEGKPTATHAGDALKEELKNITDLLGEYPHKALDATRTKAARTPQKKSQCPQCGYLVRVCANWLDSYGHVICPNCYVQLIEPDVETEERIALESIEQHAVYHVKGMTDRFEIRMFKRGKYVKWYLTDWGEPTVTVDGKPNPRALFAERVAATVPVSTREEALEHIEAIKEGLYTIQAVEAAVREEAEEVNLEDMPDESSEEDWQAQLHEDEETADYPDCELSDEELVEYEAERNLREKQNAKER